MRANDFQTVHVNLAKIFFVRYVMFHQLLKQPWLFLTCSINLKHSKCWLHFPLLIIWNFLPLFIKLPLTTGVKIRSMTAVPVVDDKMTVLPASICFVLRSATTYLIASNFPSHSCRFQQCSYAHSAIFRRTLEGFLRPASRIPIEILQFHWMICNRIAEGFC